MKYLAPQQSSISKEHTNGHHGNINENQNLILKSRNLDGYVGFVNLPNQVYRKSVKKGFDFTLMVIGMTIYSFRNFNQLFFSSFHLYKR